MQVMSALDTFISRVAWSPLDVLVLDLPPGTGDAQISIAQRLRLAGAVIVSTPQVRLVALRRAAPRCASLGLPGLCSSGCSWSLLWGVRFARWVRVNRRGRQPKSAAWVWEALPLLHVIGWAGAGVGAS